MTRPAEQLIGPFLARVSPEFEDAALQDSLGQLPQLLDASRAAGGHRSDVHRITLPHAQDEIQVAVKSFHRQNHVRALLTRPFGTKAYRSFKMACALQVRGIGTPAPVACLERWDSRGLAESYFLTIWQDGLTSLREELIHLYHQAPYYDRIQMLLQTVADTVRPMHDAGIQHGDLGNQNIMLRPSGQAGWTDVRLIDLNRGCVRDRPLNLKERGFDLSRLTLPTNLRRLFHELYVGIGKPTRAIRRAERPYLWRFRIHDKTRPLRHPIREWRVRRRLARESAPRYPAPRDYWIWDPRGGQPIGALHVKERLFLRYPLNALFELGATMLWAGPTWLGYRRAKRKCFRPGPRVTAGVGMTVNPTPATAGRELDLLRRLGPIPILARFYHHESAREWTFTAQFLRQLHAAGHSVSAALVQDRRAVLEPQRWDRFVEWVFAELGDILEWVEIGHAINRVKWGIWRLTEYRRLAQPFLELQQRYPGVRLMGPAVNDFEYQHLAAALSVLPRGLRLDALSLHLYVDRRGAPENTQYGFDATDKFALGRSMARLASGCSDRLIISEVNWWLSKHNFEDWVSEDDYADFMLRYYVMAIASGMVERVYWWRLIAEDFGLVDDGTDAWRLRPAYHMLETFLKVLGDAEFVERHMPADQVFVYRFRKTDGTEVGFAYALEACSLRLPFCWKTTQNAFGGNLDTPSGIIELGPRPVYLIGMQSS